MPIVDFTGGISRPVTARRFARAWTTSQLIATVNIATLIYESPIAFFFLTRQPASGSTNGWSRRPVAAGPTAATSGGSVALQELRRSGVDVSSVVLLPEMNSLRRIPRARRIGIEQGLSV
jgi:hypothetical protein